VRRLFAIVLGALGITAWLRRRHRPVVDPSPADDLRAKLAEAKAEPAPAPEPEPEPEPEPAARAEEPQAEQPQPEQPQAEEPQPEEPQPEEPQPDVAARRADVHDRARQAMAELRDEPE
jgi:outer membrane biosynthesis protein TonB